MANSGGLVQATMDESEARVRLLVSQGANLEEADHKQQTALLIATMTDQFEIAEVLIDAGANVWTASMFGWTPGYAAQTSRIAGGPDAEARQRVIAKLQAKGFPFPAPTPEQVEAAMEKGQWPPRRPG
jgi:hypothetical protein